MPAGSTLNRVVALTATATDAGGVAEVRFILDGTVIGTDATSPYSLDWDTSTVADGTYTLTVAADDAAGNTTQSPGISVTVDNVVQFLAALSGEEAVPPVSSSGSAQADITVNLATGEVSGTLTVNGITPNAAHIHDGYAGTTGGVSIPLDQDGGNANLFSVPAAATLDAAGIDRLLAGGLYINVHTTAVPSGELRGQMLTQDLALVFTDLEGFAAVPQVGSMASGRAAVTLNEVTGAIVVQANVNGLDDATQAHVHEAYAGDTGPVVVALNQDGGNAGRWFVEDGTLNATGLAAFAAGRLYINVHSPANPGGELRGQIAPDGIEVLFAELSGAQEVPAVDTLASGLAAVTLDAAASMVTIHVNTSRLDDATGAHLHGAYGGTNGGVEVGLTQDGGNPAHWFAEEQTLDAAQLDAVLAGATYINVHTPANQGGEVRGQVIPGNILFAYGPLGGDQVIPPVATAAGGSFAVTVDPDALTVVAHANTSGVADATAAHLHDGYAGTGGGVAVPLAQDATEMSRWSADGVAIDAGQLAAFRAGRWYVNVHTPANQGGEIRGQVAPAPVEVLFTDLSGDQEVPAVVSAASGKAATTVNRDTGEVTLHLRTSGADDAVGSHIHGAYAGQNGGVVIGLQQDANDAGHWSVVEEQFDEAGLADYLAGRLYVNLHTPAVGSGEIRGQIAPRDIQVVFTDLSGDEVVPPVVKAATGKAATTTNLKTRSMVAFVNTQGADDATGAGIHVGDAGANGAEILPLQQTPEVLSQWSAMTGALSAEDFDSYRAAGLYAQVATPAQPNGALRGQIDPPDSDQFGDPAPTATLTEIQATVFGPSCSGCHSGPTSGNLPGGMNLSSANESYAALVNVVSLQVSQDRVEPGDPDNSYLVRKLEGDAGIVGNRMPQGGPFLDQDTMNLIRQWVLDGAPNN